MNCSKVSVLELLDKMHYSYKDLYQPGQMELVREHIHGTIRLAKLGKPLQRYKYLCFILYCIAYYYYIIHNVYV